MSTDELRRALETKVPVRWQGRMDYENAIGYVSAIVYRYEKERLTVSCELTTYSNPPSRMQCRPEDVSYWRIPFGEDATC